MKFGGGCGDSGGVWGATHSIHNIQQRALVKMKQHNDAKNRLCLLVAKDKKSGLP